MNMKIVKIHEFTFGDLYVIELQLLRSCWKDNKMCHENVYAYAFENDPLLGINNDKTIYRLSVRSPYEQYMILKSLEDKQEEMEEKGQDYSEEYDLLLVDIHRVESQLYDWLNVFREEHGFEEIPEGIMNVLESIIRTNQEYKRRLLMSLYN